MDKFKRESAIGSDVGAEVATDLSSLRSALQYNYEGDNIANIIAQLLQTYRPENDIGAYERVLQKLQGLLKNCDSPRKRLLLSMIPAPKDVSDHKIAEVFATNTGFVKLNAQENDASQNVLDARNSLEITDDRVSTSKENILRDKDASGSKSSLSEGFPFRGFAENEISTTIRNHVKNVKHMHGVVVEHDSLGSEIPFGVSSNSPSRADWSQADSSSRRPNDNSQDRPDGGKCQTSICRQYLLNKRYHAPAGSAINESHSRYSSRAVYQETSFMKTSDNTEIILDLSQDKTLRLSNDIRYACKKSDDIDAYDKDTEPDVSKVAIYVDRKGVQTVEQETIKENVRRMDNVCWEDDDRSIFVDADDLLATTRVGLKTSLSNFLKRAREGTSVETPIFPRTRPYPRPYSSDAVVCSTSASDRKPATTRKVAEKALNSSTSDNGLLLKRQKADGNLRENHEKAKQEPFARVANESQTRRGSCKIGKVSELPLSRDNLDHIAEKKAVAAQRRETDMTASIYESKMIRSRSSDVSAGSSFQVHSMSELAAYKKQYYDTLLSVQRAKVAVTNSLASSSSCSLPLDHLTAYDDPYYSNYTCQQQHLFQQQRQFAAMGAQFSPTCPTALPGLTRVQKPQQQRDNQQYSWARSDYKYLLLKQLRLRRQTSSPAVYTTRDQGGWIHRYVGPMYPCRPFTPDGSSRTEQCVRRKSLEDIVGKLKGVGRGNVND